MADEKSHLPKRASPPSQGESIPPPPPEIQRRDVVWLDKGYTPPASPSPKQQHARGSDVPPPPPGLDVAWVDKGYTIPAERNIPQKKRG